MLWLISALTQRISKVVKEVRSISEESQTYGAVTAANVITALS